MSLLEPEATLDPQRVSRFSGGDDWYGQKDEQIRILSDDATALDVALGRTSFYENSQLAHIAFLMVSLLRRKRCVHFRVDERYRGMLGRDLSDALAFCGTVLTNMRGSNLDSLNSPISEAHFQRIGFGLDFVEVRFVPAEFVAKFPFRILLVWFLGLQKVR